MYTFISVLIIIVCILLILVVLVQNSKGGGLASNFSSSNQIMGVRKTADFLEKATWTLAISLLVLSLVAGLAVTGEKAEQQEVLDGMEIPEGGGEGAIKYENPTGGQPNEDFQNPVQ